MSDIIEVRTRINNHDETGQSELRNRKIYLLITIVTLVIFCFSNSTLAVGQPVKEAPASIVGEWESVDLITEFKAFNPSNTNEQERLELKGLTFMEDGSTTKPWQKWKNNLFIDYGTQAAFEFVIKTTNNTDFLILEWLPVEEINTGAKPKYYVFTRGSYVEPIFPDPITAGMGSGDVIVGADQEQIVRVLGEPDRVTEDQWFYWEEHHIESLIHRKMGALQINFNKGIGLKTRAGAQFGNTKEELVAIYGEPQEVKETDDGTALYWQKFGIRFNLTPEEGVTQVAVFWPE